MDNIEISLTRDEALVFFEFLSRFSDNDKLDIQHQAEERVLWDLTCSLEKILVAPFSKDYRTILENARDKIKDE